MIPASEPPLTLPETRAALTRAVQDLLAAGFAAAHREEVPYRHWTVAPVFPAGLTDRLRGLPFSPPDLNGLSGKRELHNDQRHYFDAANNARFNACAGVADAFQSPEVVALIERATGANLSGSYVRLEYAQDMDGFWLEPHTDLGVKRFTMLIYLAEGEDQSDLGTDVYADPETWAKRSPFVDNSALVFVPGSDTWHGLSRRPIPGVPPLGDHELCYRRVARARATRLSDGPRPGLKQAAHCGGCDLCRIERSTRAERGRITFEPSREPLIHQFLDEPHVAAEAEVQ